MKGDALRRVSHLDDLQEIWDTLDTCFERPEKYMEEALRPIVEFRKYKAADSSAVRELYSILRAAIKGARSIGRLSLMINDQTVPTRIMGKMPNADWKEWATKRPEWMREDLGPTFKRFVERKWQDALNVAAVEPQPWGSERERITTSKAATEKAPQGHKGVNKTLGTANVVTQQPLQRARSPAWEASAWTGRKCRVQLQTGCDGNHVALQCVKLWELSLSKRREALERSGLCMYCLKHAAELECYNQRSLAKPKCPQPECEGRHAAGAHKLLGEVNASVNFVAGEDYESDEDEEWWVNIVRAEGEEEGSPQELEDLGMEQDEEESEEEADNYCLRACMRQDNSGLEDELKYFRDVPLPLDTDEGEKDRWWSPGPQEPESEEEDEEENRYLVSLLLGKPKGEGAALP